jgi:dTDP-4-dehydrorhamnose reductase
VSDNTPQRIFIVGKNGQVGRELVEQAEQQGLDAVSFGSAELDITDRSAVLQAVTENKPTVVINAAAYTAVDKAEDEIDLAYAVNRDGVENLALACKAQNIPLIHISTDYVFDGTKQSPYLESDTPSPIGVYGASKLAGEIILKTTWYKHVVLRVSWVFSSHGNNFVKTMLRLAKERNELSVVGDQFGAPTAAADIAKTLLQLSGDDGTRGLRHLESNPRVSWHGFAECIFKEARDLGLILEAPVLKSIASDQYVTPVKRPENSKLATCFAVQSVEWRSSLLKVLVQLKAQQGKT